MSLLSKAQKGITTTSSLYCVYGQEGCGKSTFAAGFDKPFFIDLEFGTRHLDVTRITADDVVDYAGLLKFIQNEVLSASFTAKTLVVDCLSALEQLMVKHICGTKYKSLSDIPFGGGTVQLADEGANFMALMRKVQKEKNVDCVIIAHAKHKDYTDPHENVTYQRITLQCHDKLAEKVKAACDNVFFAKHAISTVLNDKTKKLQAYSDGSRVMYTEHRPGADAKNRIGLPYEMPLSYSALKQAIENAKPKPAEELIADIKAMVSRVDEGTRQLATAKMKEVGNDATALLRIKQKLSEMIQP